MSEAVRRVIAEYIALRDEKKAIQEKHKEELAPVNRKMEKIEAALLKRLQKDGAKNIATPDGTVYITTVTKAKVEDWSVFRPFILQHDLVDMMEQRVSKNAIEEYIEANGDVPPGIAISTENFARIKR